MGAIINVIYLTLNLLVLILIIFSYYRENCLGIVYPSVLAMLFRSQLSLLDFEGKRFDKILNINFVMFYIIASIASLSVLFNVMIGKKTVLYLLSAFTTFTGVLGCIIIERKLKGNIKQILD